MEIVNNHFFLLSVRNEATILKKLSVCVLFGGISPEHDVSLRSAESVLNNMDPEKYNIFPVGITKHGDWILYTGTNIPRTAAPPSLLFVDRAC